MNTGTTVLVNTFRGVIFTKLDVSPEVSLG
jgi:hypothetical protein